MTTIIESTVRECIAVYRIALRTGRTVPTHVIAAALQSAAEEAEREMPEQPLHLGAVYVLRRAS